MSLFHHQTEDETFVVVSCRTRQQASANEEKGRQIQTEKLKRELRMDKESTSFINKLVLHLSSPNGIISCLPFKYLELVAYQFRN